MTVSLPLTRLMQPWWWRFITKPLAGFYGAWMDMRAEGYQRGILETHRLTTTVWSVGNLTVGGSGKTPVVAFLARWAQTQGLRPVVLSRGYGGNNRKAVCMVWDGERQCVPVEVSGDEPSMLGRQLPGIPVVCAPNRVFGGRWIETHLHPDLIILDDGFQHLQLHRDFNLLVADGHFPLGNAALLPMGVLRESSTAARRAHALLYTRVPPDVAMAPTHKQLEECFLPNAVFFSRFRWSHVETHDGQVLTIPDALAHRRVVAMCGIGAAEQFFEMLQESGAIINEQLSWPDHVAYKPVVLGKIREMCDKHKPDALVTTAKDAAKLQGFNPGVPILVPHLELIFSDQRFFNELIRRAADIILRDYPTGPLENIW